MEAQSDWFDRDLWQRLVDAGVVGAACSLPGESEHGFGVLGAAIVLREIGRVVAPLPALATLALGALPIARFGSAQQRARLDAVASGAEVLTGAFEGRPDGGLAATVTAHQSEEGWVLDGDCAGVPCVHIASGVLVPARGGDTLDVFMLDPRAPGVRSTRNVNTRGEPQFDLALDSVQVREEDRIGPPGAGRAVVDWARGCAVVGICAQQVGVLERALGMTAEYVGTRHQFGRPVGSFQAVSQRAANAYIDVQVARLTMWQAASALHGGHDAHAEVAVAKYWCASAGHRVAHTAQHLHGGIGVDTDYPLHRYFLWAKYHEVAFGSASPWLANLGGLLADTEIAL